MKTKIKPSNMTPPAINIGISAADRKKITQGLSAFLADSYTLYLMTHNFHWNVTGPQFTSLHQLFMTQYTEQWTALDQIAERIRALGHAAPATYTEFHKLASIRGLCVCSDPCTSLSACLCIADSWCSVVRFSGCSPRMARHSGWRFRSSLRETPRPYLSSD